MSPSASRSASRLASVRQSSRFRSSSVRKAVLALALGTLIVASPVVRAEDGHVALFKNVTGSMKIVRGGETVVATSGTTLLVSDKVVSGVDASAGIVFKDGTLLTVGASTEVQVRDYVFEPKVANYKFDVYLAKGTAIYSSGKIGKLAPEFVKVDTPTATVGVRGTRFIVTAE